MARTKRNVPPEEEYDDEEMKEAPVWAKALYRELVGKGKNNGTRKGQTEDDDDDQDPDDDEQERPRPNRKHWLLG